MVGFNTNTVAHHLNQAVSNQRKSLLDIAVEIGFVNSEIISAILLGNIKLPYDKVIPLANALQINSGELFYITLRDYDPETFQALRPFMRTLELSQDELDVLMRYREFKS